jgi:multiple sugar transport system permease protein
MVAEHSTILFSRNRLYHYQRTRPLTLLEAAKIDGASEIRTFIAIVLPIARPAVGAIAIFAFTGGWNDYMWQLVLITKEELITLPIGVARLATNLTNIDVGLNMAGATVAFLPMLIVFLLFQDYFVKGITMGAVKG